jgi:hypothetical protein
MLAAAAAAVGAVAAATADVVGAVAAATVDVVGTVAADAAATVRSLVAVPDDTEDPPLDQVDPCVENPDDVNRAYEVRDNFLARIAARARDLHSDPGSDGAGDGDGAGGDGAGGADGADGGADGADGRADGAAPAAAGAAPAAAAAALTPAAECARVIQRYNQRNYLTPVIGQTARLIVTVASVMSAAAGQRRARDGDATAAAAMDASIREVEDQLLSAYCARMQAPFATCGEAFLRDQKFVHEAYKPGTQACAERLATAPLRQEELRQAAATRAEAARVKARVGPRRHDDDADDDAGADDFAGGADAAGAAAAGADAAGAAAAGRAGARLRAPRTEFTAIDKLIAVCALDVLMSIARVGGVKVPAKRFLQELEQIIGKEPPGLATGELIINAATKGSWRHTMLRTDYCFRNINTHKKDAGIGSHHSLHDTRLRLHSTSCKYPEFEKEFVAAAHRLMDQSKNMSNDTMKTLARRVLEAMKTTHPNATLPDLNSTYAMRLIEGIMLRDGNRHRNPQILYDVPAEQLKTNMEHVSAYIHGALQATVAPDEAEPVIKAIFNFDETLVTLDGSDSSQEKKSWFRNSDAKGFARGESAHSHPCCALVATYGVQLRDGEWRAVPVKQFLVIKAKLAPGGMEASRVLDKDITVRYSESGFVDTDMFRNEFIPHFVEELKRHGIKPEETLMIFDNLRVHTNPSVLADWSNHGFHTQTLAKYSTPFSQFVDTHAASVLKREWRRLYRGFMLDAAGFKLTALAMRTFIARVARWTVEVTQLPSAQRMGNFVDVVAGFAALGYTNPLGMEPRVICHLSNGNVIAADYKTFAETEAAKNMAASARTKVEREYRAFLQKDETSTEIKRIVQPLVSDWLKAGAPPASLRPAALGASPASQRPAVLGASPASQRPAVLGASPASQRPAESSETLLSALARDCFGSQRDDDVVVVASAERARDGAQADAPWTLQTLLEMIGSGAPAVGPRTFDRATRDRWIERLHTACVQAGSDLRAAVAGGRRPLLRSFASIICDPTACISLDAVGAGMRGLQRVVEYAPLVPLLIDDTHWAGKMTGLLRAGSRGETPDYVRELNNGRDVLAPFYFTSGRIGHWVLLHIAELRFKPDRGPSEFQIVIRCHDSLASYDPTLRDSELQRVASQLSLLTRSKRQPRVEYVDSERQPFGSLSCGNYAVHFAACVLASLVLLGQHGELRSWCEHTPDCILAAHVDELSAPLPPPQPKTRKLKTPQPSSDAALDAARAYVARIGVGVNPEEMDADVAALQAKIGAPPNTAAHPMSRESSQAMSSTK